jgi:hypothetical protein
MAVRQDKRELTCLFRLNRYPACVAKLFRARVNSARVNHD